MGRQHTVKTFASDSFAEKLARKLFGVEKPEYRDLKVRAIMWANREYQSLRARIAELETVEHLKKQQLQEEKDSLTLALSKAVKRIAELEAAQQWRDLSPMPEVKP
jgi:hypothetical protein